MVVRKWLDGDARVTIWCVVVSAVSLGLSLGGVGKGMMPFDVAWVAIILCGVPIVVNAAIALVTERDITADLLVSLALVASVVIREDFAAGEVAMIMQIGALLEDYTSEKARQGITKLVKLTPQTARLHRSGEEVVVPAEQVAVGDEVIVLAGEMVPVDGVIIEGRTSINQSVMTGESIPVDKQVGDEVSSGTINQFGTFTMRSTKLSTDSMLQRMVRLAREADANKARIVSLADRWASWMVIAAVIIAAITWAVTGQFLRAVTVLVVFCPCAFVLATPTAIMAGIGNVTKYGILVRSGDALERLSGVSTVAFDKTGTLTYGKPVVTEVLPWADRYTRDELLALAASVEKRSEHPLGKAVAASWQGPLKPVQEFAIVAGCGVRAVLDGQMVRAGKAEFLIQGGVTIPPEAMVAVQTAYGKGATVILLSVGVEYVGMITLSDTIRRDVPQTIERLKRMGVTPLLLTGDNVQAAGEIARRASITEVRANLLPEGKMQCIKEREQGGSHVCMIGDGVNDALALEGAYAGIAMGGVGSDIAVESADAVLVEDDMKRVPYLLAMSRRTMKKVRANIIISLSINLVAVTLSIMGVLNPVTGALMHNCGSVCVVLNAALLLRYRDEE
ncbi:MAG: cation-translocating P-type ATPase [Sphaerochaeta sp.]|nr:cation-translocating P-type ATPase [Sphaerochaeta sp.]